MTPWDGPVRVLVVYGSTRGGTSGLATMVAEAFVAQGIPADVGDAAEVDDVAAYDAVVVGGGLYNNRWHPDAVWFVERNLDALLPMSVWFFSSGPLDDSARSGALAPVNQVRELARLTDIRGHMTFGGLLEKRASLLPTLFGWGRIGDFRDRQQVNEWVARIIARLREAKPSVTTSDDPPAAAGAAGAAPANVAVTGEGPPSGDAADEAAVDDDSVDEDLGLDVFSDS